MADPILDAPVRSLRLKCLIEGEYIVFPVTAVCNDKVSDLKEVVQSERAQSILKDIDPHTLELWKLKDSNSIAAEPDDTLGERIELLEDDLSKFADELKAVDSVFSIFSTQPPRDYIHIIVKAPAADKCTHGTLDIADIADISTDILSLWSKNLYHYDEKIPLTRIRFNNLLSGLTETTDFCHEEHVERLFRISDTEASEILHLTFYRAVVLRAPPESGTEPSFHSFWDENIRRILELLVPSGTSIRGSNRRTNIKKIRPDYGFLKDNVCLFRGEEEHPESRDDPKAELSDKLTWVYSPAPYVFGYYAIGPDLTLAAICAPSTPSQMPVVQDLASANLRFKRDRIANLCRLINLSSYLYPLQKHIGYRDISEFTVIERYVLSYHLGGVIDLVFQGRHVNGNRDNKCQKIYRGNQGAERVRYIQNIYRQLQEKGVPHVDALIHAVGSTIYVEPKGIAVKPSNVKELLDAVICVLRALQVLHQAPPLFHRDIRWPNVLRRAEDHTLWFLIDWEDAVGPNNVAAKHFRREGHSPRVFIDNHGAEVDIWSESTSPSTFDLSPELVELGKWMQNVAPDAKDALIAVEAYA
ncbi:hypothetical protein F5887DRAFT_1062542 [Amanita rubescens]|nr:hypothetical protein F5887DRAFT_1062542 [Amanita rubescens]